MIIKVCGMTDPDNIGELARLPVDIIGLIFFKDSPRSVDPGNHILAEKIRESGMLCAGVFVNEKLSVIKNISREFDLDVIQLHGSEPPEFCNTLRENHRVVKAVHPHSKSDLPELEKYQDAVDWFLFDTISEVPGGTGRKFNWNILDSYHLNIPFLLSGGIGPGDETLIRGIHWPLFKGVDVNSRFEIRPGLKDIPLLRAFIENVK